MLKNLVKWTISKGAIGKTFGRKKYDSKHFYNLSGNIKTGSKIVFYYFKAWVST